VVTSNKGGEWQPATSDKGSKQWFFGIEKKNEE